MKLHTRFTEDGKFALLPSCFIDIGFWRHDGGGKVALTGNPYFQPGR